MKWFVVRNGSIVFSGSEKECSEIVANDMSGELEMYPASAKTEWPY
jgi:hypothetical protein